MAKKTVTKERSLTAKQEKFAQNLFIGMSQFAAYKDAYQVSYARSAIDSHASRLAKVGKIRARFKELQETTNSDKVMSVAERKTRLTEIARARLTDYQESGMDGGWINIGKESPNTGAIREIVSTTRYDENGAHPTLVTRIRLHDPIQAIQELNKMEKVYSEALPVNIDNRRLVIIVKDERTKELLESIEGA